MNPSPSRPAKASIAAFVNRNPRLVRAAGWALLGGAAGWLVIYVPFSVEPFGGLVWSTAIGLLLWRGGHVGWPRAAGFALLAMCWFVFGLDVGYEITGWDLGPFDRPSMLVEYFAGFLTASLWVTLVGLLLAPALRSRQAVAWLLGAGAGFAALAGASNFVDLAGDWDFLLTLIAAWGAVQAAGFAMALPARLKDTP